MCDVIMLLTSECIAALASGVDGSATDPLEDIEAKAEIEGRSIGAPRAVGPERSYWDLYT